MTAKRRPKPGPVSVAPPAARIETLAYVRFMSEHWPVWMSRATQILSDSHLTRTDSFDVATLVATWRDLFDTRAFRSFLRRIGQSIDTKAKRYTARVVRIQPKAPATTEGSIEAFVERNVRLVKDLGDEHAKDLVDAIIKARDKGLRHEQLAPVIQQRLDVGASRAKLIARDQTTKLNGQLQAQHQQASGVVEFQWSTSRDGAVRQSHRELEGRIFRFDRPPVVDGELALPGEPIQCRCTAIPVIPLLAGL
jgi:SPP1 gp7 family putative phage head morphogenesis protein